MSIYEALADRFFSSFRQNTPWRTIGREAEHPVVFADGTACDISLLWPYLRESGVFSEKFEADLLIALENDELSIYSEVGKGTVEVIVGPCSDLNDLCSLHERAMEMVVRAAEQVGAKVLGYGIQPKTLPSYEFMTGKQRYGLLLQRIGEPWLSFTLTASDQVHVDVARHEALFLANLCNALCPMIVALCANSSIHGEKSSGVMSSREHMMGQIQGALGRHGMPTEPFLSERAFIETLSAYEFYMVKRPDAYESRQGPFSQYLEQSNDLDEQLWQDFLMHEHYVWHSARLRNNQSTIELRSACQQPPSEHMVVSALSLAIVEAAKDIDEMLVRHYGDSRWQSLHKLHHRVIKAGLQADEFPHTLLENILERCHSALEARGRGEESYLAPLFSRLSQKMSPGQQAVTCFEQQGIRGLIDSLSWS